jgi:hypothetical protein
MNQPLLRSNPGNNDAIYSISRDPQLIVDQIIQGAIERRQDLLNTPCRYPDRTYPQDLNNPKHFISTKADGTPLTLGDVQKMPEGQRPSTIQLAQFNKDHTPKLNDDGTPKFDRSFKNNQVDTNAQLKQVMDDTKDADAAGANAKNKIDKLIANSPKPQPVPSTISDKLDTSTKPNPDVTQSARNLANNQPAPANTPTAKELADKEARDAKARLGPQPTQLKFAPNAEDVSRVPKSKDPKDDNHNAIHEGMQGPAVLEAKKNYNLATENQMRSDLKAQGKSDQEITQAIKEEKAKGKDGRFADETNDQWTKDDGFTQKVKDFQKDNKYKNISIGDPKNPGTPDGVWGWRTDNAAREKAKPGSTPDNPPDIKYEAKQPPIRRGLPGPDPEKDKKKQELADPKNAKADAYNQIGEGSWKLMTPETHEELVRPWQGATPEQREGLRKQVWSKEFQALSPSEQQKQLTDLGYGKRPESETARNEAYRALGEGTWGSYGKGTQAEITRQWQGATPDQREAIKQKVWTEEFRKLPPDQQQESLRKMGYAKLTDEEKKAEANANDAYKQIGEGTWRLYGQDTHDEILRQWQDATPQQRNALRDKLYNKDFRALSSNEQQDALRKLGYAKPTEAETRLTNAKNDAIKQIGGAWNNYGQETQDELVRQWAAATPAQREALRQKAWSNEFHRLEPEDQQSSLRGLGYAKAAAKRDAYNTLGDAAWRGFQQDTLDTLVDQWAQAKPDEQQRLKRLVRSDEFQNMNVHQQQWAIWHINDN